MIKEATLIREATFKFKVKVKYEIIKGHVPVDLLEDVVYTALVNGGSISGEDYLLLLPNHILLTYKQDDFKFELLITERELCH